MTATSLKILLPLLLIVLIFYVLFSSSHFSINAADDLDELAVRQSPEAVHILNRDNSFSVQFALKVVVERGLVAIIVNRRFHNQHRQCPFPLLKVLHAVDDLIELVMQVEGRGGDKCSVRVIDSVATPAPPYIPDYREIAVTSGTVIANIFCIIPSPIAYKRHARIIEGGPDNFANFSRLPYILPVIVH
jgi:hypothetical protein